MRYNKNDGFPYYTVNSALFYRKYSVCDTRKGFWKFFKLRKLYPVSFP